MFHCLEIPTVNLHFVFIRALFLHQSVEIVSFEIPLSFALNNIWIEASCKVKNEISPVEMQDITANFNSFLNVDQAENYSMW